MELMWLIAAGDVSKRRSLPAETISFVHIQFTFIARTVTYSDRDGNCSKELPIQVLF